MSHQPIETGSQELPIAIPEPISTEEGVVFRLLVEAMPLAVFACANGKIQYTNPAGDILLGSREIEDVIDQDFLRFVHPRDTLTVAEMLDRPSKPGNTIAWKSVRVIRRGGEEAPVELAAADIGNGCVQVVARKLPARKLHRFSVERKWSWKNFHDMTSKTR
jgi:PAS domain S-box-containing protein